VNPLGWDDTESGALFGPDVGTICEPCPTVIIGFMVEVVNPLSWDDADSGAPTIDVVGRTCESRRALMVGVMNPLGWAFTGPLILDPSVRWLTLSPAREAPGWDFVRWLMEGTGSVRRHMEGQPGPFGEGGRGARNEPVAHDIATDRAGTTSPASSSTPTLCCSTSLSTITWSMAGGAPFAPPGPPSSAGSRPSHTGAGSQGTAGGRARTSRPTPAPACRRPPGSSRIPQRPLTAGDGVTPTDDLTRSAKRTAAPPPITLSAERRRRRRRRHSAPRAPERTPTRSSRRRRSPAAFVRGSQLEL